MQIEEAVPEQRSASPSQIEQVSNSLSARFNFFKETNAMKNIPEDGADANGSDIQPHGNDSHKADSIGRLEKMLEDISGHLQEQQQQKQQNQLDRQLNEASVAGNVTARQRWHHVRETNMDWLALRPGQDEEDAEKGRLGLLDEEVFNESIEEIEALPPAATDESFGVRHTRIRALSLVTDGLRVPSSRHSAILTPRGCVACVGGCVNAGKQDKCGAVGASDSVRHSHEAQRRGTKGRRG